MRRPILVALLALLALPASAHAAFFPAEVIDGPSPDIVEASDVDIARDGQGGMVYVKREGGVPHIFFSAFSDGAFQPPVRVDQGLAPASSQPVIGASDNGRLAIAWVNDGSLFTAVRPKDAPGLTPPALLAQGGVSSPSIDVSINGASYVSWTQNADVYAARAERDNPQFRQLPAAMDVLQPAAAGESARKASRIDVSADGTAVVVWGEAGSDGRNHVYARRLFELRLSAAPQDLTVDTVEGVAATGADSPEIDTEDDSSYAQVTFRQNTANGPRLLMRRLVGSQFNDPFLIDGGLPGERARIDLSGRGEGLFAGSAQGGQVIGGTLFNNKVSSLTRLDPGNAVAPNAVPALGENEIGVVSWMQGGGPGDAVLRARAFDGVMFLKLGAEAVLSRPEWGPVHVGGGLDAEASRAGDVAVVFVQGGPADRRVVAAFNDQPPARIAGSNTEKIRKLTTLRWPASRNLFGGTRYRVIVDGRQIAETASTELALTPGQIPDGEHRWQIQIADRRGQLAVSRTRRLRVDNTPPSLRVGMKKSGRVLTVTAKGGDPDGKLPSGLSRILVDYGDGRLLPMRRKSSRRFARSGRFTVRVKALDKAGNATVVTRRVRIGG